MGTCSGVWERLQWQGMVRRTTRGLGTLRRCLFFSSAGQSSGLLWPQVPVPDQCLATYDWLAHRLQQANMMTTISCSMFKFWFGCLPHSSPFAKQWRSCGRVKISVHRTTAFSFSGKALSLQCGYDCFIIQVWLILTTTCV